jgi:hypothetical protein
MTYKSLVFFKKVRKKPKLPIIPCALMLVFCMLALPTASCLPVSGPSSLPERQTPQEGTQRMFCQVSGTRIIKNIPITEAQHLTSLFNLSKQDFLTILNTTRTDADADLALFNLQPLFQALYDVGLTDMNATGLTRLYHEIREKIGSARQNLLLKPGGMLHPLGLWNGVPLPAQLNAACGILAFGGGAAGWVAGTHTLIPTIGADVFLAAGFDGTTVTLGIAGATLQDLAQFIVIFGFAGILLGCLPTGVIVALLFLAGFSVLYLGIGPPV